MSNTNTIKYRNINTLIKAIRNEVPDMWNYKTSFDMALDNVIDSSHYRAPEAYVVNFDQLANVLYDYIGEPDEDWKKKIADIFNGKVEVPEMDYIEL